MRRRASLLNLLSAVTAASMALVIIVGLAVEGGFLAVLVALVLQIVVVTAALAVLIGLSNLLRVHWRRVQRGTGAGSLAW
ncbi:MAG: hypothetical protein HC915_11000 [Anaerolineae bacterium]|nr:hypothetical protein [Anaerolineae bacterium]